MSRRGYGVLVCIAFLVLAACEQYKRGEPKIGRTCNYKGLKVLVLSENKDGTFRVVTEHNYPYDVKPKDLSRCKDV